jgi:hypothetical protein
MADLRVGGSTLEPAEDDRVAWSFWNPKRNTDERIDADQIRGYTRNMLELARRTVNVARAAARWHTASGRPGETR